MTLKRLRRLEDKALAGFLITTVSESTDLIYYHEEDYEKHALSMKVKLSKMGFSPHEIDEIFETITAARDEIFAMKSKLLADRDEMRTENIAACKRLLESL